MNNLTLFYILIFALKIFLVKNILMDKSSQ